MKNPNIEPVTCVLGKSEDLESEALKWSVAQRKYDGHRCIMVSTGKKCYFYSRRTSKITGEKEDNTDRLPYLHDLALDVTGIFDGELIANWCEESTSSEVQKILGATPEKAKQLWEEGYTLTYIVFGDITKYYIDHIEDPAFMYDYDRFIELASIQLCYGTGMRIQKNIPYIKRALSYTSLNSLTEDSFIFTNDNCFSTDIKDLLNLIYLSNQEGMVLKDIRTPEKTLTKGGRTPYWKKFKQVNTAELVIMSLVPPSKKYTGKFTKEELINQGWSYWEDGEPVTKTYALNQPAGLVLGAYDDSNTLVPITTVKGFKEKDIPSLVVGKVVEISYQNLTKQSFRHPRFKCIREDKNPEDCKLSSLFNH